MTSASKMLAKYPKLIWPLVELTCGNKLHYSQRVIKQVCLLQRRVQGGSLLLTCTLSHKACAYLLQSLSKWAGLLQLVLGVGVIIIIIYRNSL